jgi:hypothetical protein
MKTLLYLAAALQLLILTASIQVPRVLDWKSNLSALRPFLRRLFWVYGTFIVLVIGGFSILTFLNAGAMAAGEPVARSLCAFITVFWAARLFVQFAIFDPGPFLATRLQRIGYHLLGGAFVVLVLVYGWAAAAPRTDFFL